MEPFMWPSFLAGLDDLGQRLLYAAAVGRDMGILAAHFLNLWHAAANTRCRPAPPKQHPSPSALRKILPAVSKTALRENIYTLPNLLTASRLLAAPFIGYCILHEYHAMALGLFAYAGITDLLDGWIARRWNLKTVVGTIIDPMADKTLMTVLTVALAMKGALPGTCLPLFVPSFPLSLLLLFTPYSCFFLLVNH